MTWIEYDYICNENLGITLHKKVEYNEANLAIAQQEAIDGNYALTEDEETAGIQPMSIELGGTNAKTAAQALANLGGAPKDTGIQLYTHSSGALTGTGTHGKFKATSSGTISSIKVNGTAKSVKCGEETSIDLVSGCWYIFILDGSTINFSTGGAGAGINFKVVGGTSAPASPKENTIWVNTNTAVHGWDFSATEPCRRSKNRNLLTYPYYHTTFTENGITFTDNKDGTVTANGTSTAQARFRPFHQTVESGKIWLEPGTYFVSGCPSGGSASTWLWEAFDADNNVTLAKDYGKGAKFTLTAGTHVRGSLIIQSGVTVSKQVWKPQIEKGSSATSFIKGDATGQLWFDIGTLSNAPFNAVKKNGIKVYPISVRQYVNGAWVKKTAKTYQNGAWVDWYNGELFFNGEQYTDITGGWVGYNGIGEIVTIKEDSIVFNLTGTTDRDATAYTVNRIDLVNYTKIIAIIDIASGSTAEEKFTLAVMNSNTNNDPTSYVAQTTISGKTGGVAGKHEVTLDVSDVDTSCYVALCTRRYQSVIVTIVRME